jgi:ectoine hydroxylase-related dioxygenase (phytanoyl-CoA dioxygenase family)
MAGLTDAERAAWDADGVFVVRDLFPAPQLAALQSEASRLISAELGTRGSDGMGEFRNKPTLDAGLTEVVETEDTIGELLVTVDPVWRRIAELLGHDFVFAGSELNRAGGEYAVQGWHCDRGTGPDGSNMEELAFARVKLMVFLTTTTADHGSIRVLPGSHRAPLHGETLGLLQDGGVSRNDETGLDGAYTFESQPGDAIFWHHCMFHGAWNKYAGRLYAVAKFAARPVSAEQFDLFDGYYFPESGYPVSLAARRSPRLRQLAARDDAMRQDFARAPPVVNPNARHGLTAGLPGLRNDIRELHAPRL